MRAIDADKIVYSWQVDADGQEHDGVTLQSIIDKMPTIEPERKKGKWIVVDDGCISGKCSVCGWEAHMYEDDVVGMDYCPNCGARLEGEG